MKSWYVTVLTGAKQVDVVKCLSVKQVDEKLKLMKEKYVNHPEDPTAPHYVFMRELY
jgi:hypothetical protein